MRWTEKESRMNGEQVRWCQFSREKEREEIAMCTEGKPAEHARKIVKRKIRELVNTDTTQLSFTSS